MHAFQEWGSWANQVIITAIWAMGASVHVVLGFPKANSLKAPWRGRNRWWLFGPYSLKQLVNLNDISKTKIKKFSKSSGLVVIYGFIRESSELARNL